MERKAGEMAEICGSCSASHQMYIYDHICFGMDENYGHAYLQKKDSCTSQDTQKLY